MTISDWFKALDKPEYVHVLVNHLPVTGLGVALIVLILGPIFRNRMMIFVGLALVGLFALSAYPAVYYGEAGYDRVYSMAYEAGQAWLDHHRELANTWKWLYYATGAIALVALALGLWKRKTLWTSVPLVIALTLASLVAGAVISEAGGQVRHREFRVGAPPSHNHGHAQNDEHAE